MSHPSFFEKKINHVSPDICAMEEKKSAIFSLPLHKYQVKRDLSKIRNDS